MKASEVSGLVALEAGEELFVIEGELWVVYVEGRIRAVIAGNQGATLMQRGINAAACDDRDGLPDQSGQA